MLPSFRSLLVSAFVVLLGGPVPAALPAQSGPVRVRLPGNPQWVWIDSVATDPVAVAAARPVVYQAASAVLQELRVPLTTDEPRVGLLGNGGFTMVRTLGRTRLSRYLDCGTGAGGPNADLRRVTMALFMWVDSIGPAESRVRVGVLAGAQDLEGVSRPAVSCGSTGALELFLTDAVRKRAETGSDW